MLADFWASFMFFDQSMEERKLPESLPVCSLQWVCIGQIQIFSKERV